VKRGEQWDADGGFLFVPDGEFAWAYTNAPRTLEDLADFPVLVLLGEPGMGKSQALLDEKGRLDGSCNLGAEVLYRNLNEYGAGEQGRLLDDLFRCDAFQRYQHGGRLHLLLDSLDECRLEIPRLPIWLGTQLREHVTAPERLFLRIACRNGAWPGTLESTLTDVWGDEQGSRVACISSDTRKAPTSCRNSLKLQDGLQPWITRSGNASSRMILKSCLPAMELRLVKLIVPHSWTS